MVTGDYQGAFFFVRRESHGALDMSNARGKELFKLIERRHLSVRVRCLRQRWWGSVRQWPNCRISSSGLYFLFALVQLASQGTSVRKAERCCHKGPRFTPSHNGLAAFSALRGRMKRKKRRLAAFDPVHRFLLWLLRGLLLLKRPVFQFPKYILRYFYKDVG